MLRIQLGFWILRMSRIFSDHYQNILVKALSEKAKNIKTWVFVYKMLQYEHCIINCLINILAFLIKTLILLNNTNMTGIVHTMNR
jgi:hypothetical protein